MKHALEVLEFDKVRRLVASRTVSSLGRERAEKMQPVTNPEVIKERLEATHELRELVAIDGQLPLRGLVDIRSSLERVAAEGARLRPEELLALASTLGVVRALRDFIRGREDRHPRIWEQFSRLHPFPQVERRIAEAIGPDGEMLDGASSRLRQLRREQMAARDRLRDRLHSILESALGRRVAQDEIITMRGGRFVIPVRESQQSELSGIIHDRSASGATVFVEPMAVVDLNNHLCQLSLAEREEVERILGELSASIRELLGDMIENVAVLGEVDFLHAKALLAVDLNAVNPEMSREGVVNLVEARHPLLERRSELEGVAIHEVVPLTLRLGNGNRTLLITGPNTGGKTVALKTVGLLALMAQSGLLVPAREGSSLPIFRGVFADIGDEQSIEQSLSTFSSHAQQLIDILNRADEHSLVLIDELGAGTDPAEGVALGRAILEVLTERRVLLVATTHHGSLKAFVHERQGMENGSMEFDDATLSPTFRFRPGIPGGSYALAICRRLGMPGQVVDRAAQEVGTEGMALERLLSDLQREYEEQERLRDSIQRKEDQLSSIVASYGEKMATAAEDRRRLREEALREAEEIVCRARGEVERAIAMVRQGRAEREVIRESHQIVDRERARIKRGLKEVAKPRKRGLEAVAVGDRVWVDPLSAEGEVTAVHRGDRATVLVGQVHLDVSVGHLSPARGARKKPVSRARFSMPEAISPELDLRGRTGDEAEAEIDQYLDRAYLAGLEEVRIIHGKGTGALRRQVTRYLEGHPRVRSARLGEWNEGGDGVTIVVVEGEG